MPLPRLAGLVAVALAAGESSALPVAASSPMNASVVSVFGSSVANGAFCSGNCSGNPGPFDSGGCYQSKLRQHIATHQNRSVFNNCHGGDTTVKLLARFDQMLAPRPRFVFIGLSLANEGIQGADPDAIYAQYARNMRTLIEQARSNGVEPVIGLCYPNSLYTATQYRYIRRMNLLVNSWDVPSSNFLGAIDDGQGRWVSGYHVNSGHPNDAGSAEMYLTIVPSIFDAIAAGKTAAPARVSDPAQFLALSNPARVEWRPPASEPVHSFSLAFGMRCDKCSGQVAAVLASPGPAPTPAPPSECGTWCTDHNYKPDECNCGVCGSFGGCTFSCSPGGGRVKCDNSTAGAPAPAPALAPAAAFGGDTTTVSLTVDSSGALSFGGAAGAGGNRGDGTGGAAGGPVVNDNQWHTVVLTHYYCNGTTSLYVDGARAAPSRNERLAPTNFALAPVGGAAVNYQDLAIWRAGLNDDEVAFHTTNKTAVLQASLEIYAPLANEAPAENRAQSLSTVSVSVSHNNKQHQLLTPGF